MRKVAVVKFRSVLNFFVGTSHTFRFIQGLAQTKRSVRKKKTTQMEKAGMIEPAETKCLLPTVFVPKKSFSIQFLVYSRQLSLITEEDSHLISRMHEFNDFGKQSKLFSNLADNSGNWRSKMDKRTPIRRVLLHSKGCAKISEYRLLWKMRRPFFSELIVYYFLKWIISILWYAKMTCHLFTDFIKTPGAHRWGFATIQECRNDSNALRTYVHYWHYLVLQACYRPREINGSHKYHRFRQKFSRLKENLGTAIVTEIK